MHIYSTGRFSAVMAGLVAAVALDACSSSATTTSTKPSARTSTSATGTSAARCTQVRSRLTQYPRLAVDVEPQRISGAMPRMRPLRGDTAFTVSFVVDAAGKPMLKTFDVSNHVGKNFENALRGSVASWRYAPAQLDGCKVARRVSHTINVAARARSAPSGQGTKPDDTSKPRGKPPASLRADEPGSARSDNR